MATATRVGELQALSFSVSHRGDDLVLHYDPFFSGKNRIGVETLPRSVIAQSLADLLQTYPNGFFAQFALFVISDELRALLSLLHLGYSSPPSDPKRTMSKNAMSFFLGQFITESRAVSSLVPQEPMTSKGLLLL